MPEELLEQTDHHPIEHQSSVALNHEANVLWGEHAIAFHAIAEQLPLDAALPEDDPIGHRAVHIDPHERVIGTRRELLAAAVDVPLCRHRHSCLSRIAFM